jgi:hypothetical protein
LETALGRERFVELFQHIRMIYQREKPRELLEVGFPKFVKSFKNNPDAFMRSTLLKYGDIYQTVITPAEMERKYGTPARSLVANLLRLDNYDWWPVTLYYLSREAMSKLQVEAFLRALERIAYFMFVTRYDINARIARYARAITQLQQGIEPNSAKCDLTLTPKEKRDFMTELDGAIYEKARVRLPLLLRLDAAFTDGGATYDHGIITVEHVMPQNPKSDSPWLSMFDDEEDRYRWTHRLGNLVLLTRAKNSQASNWDFDRKKTEYFSSKAGVSSFKLTTMVLKERKWDQKTLERRHRELMQKLGEIWDLDI